MFYKLRYIFLFFFFELALISQAVGYQESISHTDVSVTADTHSVFVHYFSDLDQRDFGDLYEPYEQNENSQEDEHDTSNLTFLFPEDHHLAGSLKKNYGKGHNNQVDIRELPLFLLFHSWKIHC